jgi:hypothetical protein
MSGIKDYSTTPSSNTSLFPENMAPSAVNDGMRQVQADIRSYTNDAEWFNWGDTPSQASSTTFKIPTNVTARYSVHRRIKCFDTSTIYATIISSIYSNPDTTVTVATDSGNLSTSLSSIAIALLTPSSISIPSTIGRKGADIASATTTDIGAASGDFVDVTGTTTITGLGTITAGVERTVRFTGALTLTHNATSLILPGEANISTADGDTAIFRSLGSGNWKCISYTKKDGTATVTASTLDINGLTEDTTPDGTADYFPSYDASASGNKKVLLNNAKDWIKITSTTASSSSSVVFTGLSSTYNLYIIEITDLVPSTDNTALWLRTSSNNGSSYDASASDYNYQDWTIATTTAATGGTDGDSKISAIDQAGTGSNETISGLIHLHKPSTSTFTRFSYTFSQSSQASAAGRARFGVGARRAASATNAIQFIMSSGNIASGVFTLYGVRA